MEKEKLIKYLRAQMGDPFMVDIAKKFLSWINEEKPGPVGKFFMEAMEGAERGEFKSDREKRMIVNCPKCEEEMDVECRSGDCENVVTTS